MTWIGRSLAVSLIAAIGAAASATAASATAASGSDAPPAAATRPAAPDRIAAVLLVTVDTLRADRLGCYGSPLGATPSLDRLAAAGEVFLAAHAAAPSTLPSVAALLTGHYPESFGLLDNLSVYPGTFPTLAERLRRAGWRTGAVVSNWLLREHSGLAAGFEVYDAAYPRLEERRSLPEREARATTDAALRTLDALLRLANGAAVFLWVHYQDPHGPYVPPGGRREPFLAAQRAAPGADRELRVLDDESGRGGIPRYQYLPPHREAAWYRAGYDGEVAWTDEQVGRLLDGFDARVPRDRSLVVLTADHGEGLGEDDYWFAHGEMLSDPLVRVPLLVRAPGRRAGARHDVVSLVDVVPTVLGVLGVAGDASLRGRDLLAPGAESASAIAYFTNVYGALVPRRGIVTPRLRHVVELRPDGPVESFEGFGGAAGGVVDAAAREEARVALARMHAEVTTATPRAPAPLSEEDRARLRALGYAD